MHQSRAFEKFFQPLVFSAINFNFKDLVNRRSRNIKRATQHRKNIKRKLYLLRLITINLKDSLLFSKQRTEQSLLKGWSWENRWAWSKILASRKRHVPENGRERNAPSFYFLPEKKVWQIFNYSKVPFGQPSPQASATRKRMSKD